MNKDFYAMRRYTLLPLLACLCFCCAFGVLAATDFSAPDLSGPIDVEADSLAYDATRNLIIGTGNVRVTSGTDSVAADYAEVDTQAGDVYARGNILIHYRGNVWRGEETHYNFRSGLGEFGAFEAFVPPFTIIARDSRRISTNMVELQGVILTTCDADNLEYSVRASKATLQDGNLLRAKNVRFNFGPVPFFWFPYVKAGLDWFANFEFVVGSKSDLGLFLLTTYNYPISPKLKTHTHVDYRTKRGFGVGETIDWHDPAGAYDGMLRLYYAHDDKPWKDDTQRAAREEIIEESRYWIQLKDRHSISSRDYVMAEFNYLADPWLIPDFFDDEYQHSVVPENRATVTHVGDRYIAAAAVNLRLNDFYDNINRLPEVTLDLPRQQVFDTPLYYESENALSYLEHVYPDASTAEDYDAFRMDTYHSLYWPTRQFGFLSLIPRAAIRGTYYSDSLKTTYSTNVVAVQDENGVSIGTTNRVDTHLLDDGAVFRVMPELGMEASFKAFRNLYHGPTGIEADRDLRHVAEPYMDYTLRFDPNVEPHELWRFDRIDRLDKLNALTLGMRNKLQTRRNESVHNLIYLDAYTQFLLDPDEDEETWGYLGFNAEIRPWTWLLWDFDATIKPEEGELNTFTTQVEFRSPDIFRLSLDYRYSVDIRNQIAGDLVLFPDSPWSLRAYMRVDLDDSDIEEHSYYLIRRTRCLGIGLGLRIRPDEGTDGEDDYSVWFRIWPLAFAGSFSAVP